MEFEKMLNIFLSLAGMSFIVFIHELGHYIFSRLNGVFVEEFAIGFGKKLFSFKSASGTIWSFRIFPLGGFVRNRGDADATSFSPNKNIEKTEDSINSKRPIQKFLICIAGPLFNFILSFVVFFFLYFSMGKQTILPQITHIKNQSLAEKYSLKNGDIVRKINNTNINDFRGIQKAILLNKEENLNFTIQRDSKILNIIIPFSRKAEPVGISGDKIIYKKFNPIHSLVQALKDVRDISYETCEGFKLLIKGDVDRKNIGGPISIINATTKALAKDHYSFFVLIAIISINLGIINLLPIPIVDGGQAFIHLIEMIIKKDLTYSKFKKFLFYIGFGILITLMLFSFYNDIIKIITK